MLIPQHKCTSHIGNSNIEVEAIIQYNQTCRKTLATANLNNLSISIPLRYALLLFELVKNIQTPMNVS